MHIKIQRGFTYAQLLLGIAATVIAGIAVTGLVSTVMGGATTISRSISGSDALTHAATTLIAEATLDSDGVLLPPAGITPLGCAISAEATMTSCWQIPATSKAPKVDTYGSNLGYCAWNHGTSNTGAGILTGISPATNDLTALAVISPGKDRLFQTSCTQAKTGISGGDDQVKFITLAMASTFKNGALAWLDPVDCKNAASPTVDTLGNAVNCAVLSQRDSIATGTLASGTLLLTKKAGELHQWNGAAWILVSGAAGGYNVASMNTLTFTPVNDAALTTVYATAGVQLTGIGNAILVTSSGGQFAVSTDGSSWGVWQTMGQIDNNQYIKLQQTSSGAFSTTTTTTLNIGGTAKTWNVTTLAADAVPDAFSFTDQTGVATNAVITSNTITITGINTPAAMSVSGTGLSPQCSVASGAWGPCATTIANNQTLAVRQTSSAAINTPTTLILTIGGVSSTWTVTTLSQIYVDDVFSAYTYTGNDGTQTIMNGIDLAGYGGMVWVKQRDGGFNYHHVLVDSARGVNKYLSSNLTDAQVTEPTPPLSSFNANGFSLASPTSTGAANNTATNYIAWAFRKAPKFFDVVTYTGDGVANRQISHALGIAPGMVIIKRTDSSAYGGWLVWHRAFGAEGRNLSLNTTGAAIVPERTAPTSTSFYVSGSTTYIGGENQSDNLNGATYVAYVFAHDTAANGLIQCGSYSHAGGAANPIILGWEPQFVLRKWYNGTENWSITDISRGMGSPPAGGGNGLFPNTTSSEMISSGLAYITPTATGFVDGNTNSRDYIYCAIRRPNKPPTAGTQVYGAVPRAGTSGTSTITGAGFPIDLVIVKEMRPNALDVVFSDRLRGANKNIYSSSTVAEVGIYNNEVMSYDMDGVTIGVSSTGNVNGASGSPTFINYFFKRAPGFFDIVAYTGTGADIPQGHSLGVIPELSILKPRDTVSDWLVNYNFSGAGGAPQGRTYLNLMEGNFGGGGIVAATATSITPSGYYSEIGRSSIVYLFASLPGISKIGTYTGAVEDVTIDAGFSGSPRFVLIKRQTAFGGGSNWLVFDTTRGIVNGGADPTLALNSTAAEWNSINYIEPTGSGFIAKTGNAEVNADGATYLYMTIR